MCFTCWLSLSLGLSENLRASVKDLIEPFTDIYLINVDGSGLRKLTSGSGLNGSPSWSPDGRQIVFSSNRDGMHKIYVMNADGSNQHAVADRGTQPSWSPDGSKILFVGERGDATGCGTTSGNLICEQLYTVNPRGSDLTQLTHYAASYQSPKWSPDGTKLRLSAAQSERSAGADARLSGLQLLA